MTAVIVTTEGEIDIRKTKSIVRQLMPAALTAPYGSTPWMVAGTGNNC